MKTKLLLLSSFAFLMANSLFAQTSGGPDAFGYIWRNSNDAQGPVYNWKEIKGIGTQITGLGDDNSAGPFNLNWNFRYYWSDVNKVVVGSNGWVRFGTTLGNIAAPFPNIPTSTGVNNFVAPQMFDLTFTGNSGPAPGATAWYWTNNADTMIVQYDSVPYWANPNPGYFGRYTFQVIFSGADSSITFQYKLAQAGTTPYDMAGEGLKIGIENSTGQIGLQPIDGIFATAGTAIKFYYPNPVTFQVFDAAPAWNQNPENGGFFVSGPFGPPLNLSTNIANTGNQGLGSFNVTGTLFDASLIQVWTSNLTAPALSAGQDTTMTYPTTYAANTAGTYIYRSTTTLSTDMNPGNDVTDNEMVVVDTSQAIVALSFTEATTTTTGLNWQGGGATSGGGVYFIPPFYPATVVSLDYFIAGGNTGGFTAAIYDDDGANNSPNTVLFNTQIATATIGAYYNVTVTPPVTIASGGVYVGWFMFPDTTCALGTDAAIPVSNRNYEIIGGSWAPYRNNTAEDLMIKMNIQGSNSVGMADLSNEFSVAQNYPNPSATYTLINISLPASGDVSLSVRNMVGQQVNAVQFGNRSAGTHTIRLSTADLSPGIYFYTVKYGDAQVTKKFIVSR